MDGILVVGGGIAGLTFGVAARRLGIEVSIVERLATVPAGAAGIGLHLNAQRALGRIGLADRVEAVAVPDGGFRVFDARGARWRTWTTRRCGARRPGRCTVPT